MLYDADYFNILMKSLINGVFYFSYSLLRIYCYCQLGVFEMSQLGLQAVSNPSKIFLSEQHSDSEFLAGLAVAVIMDGSRSFLIEIQVYFLLFVTFSF